MRRILKQFFYGLIYLAFIASLGVSIYYSFFSLKPTCFDNLKNQNEEEVDCGGSCISCELKTLSLKSEAVKVFPAGQFKSTLLVKITNPSSNYGLRSFDYNLEVFSHFGTRLALFNKKSSILPNEIKYLVLPAIDIDSRDIKEAVFNILVPKWEEAIDLPRFNLKIEGINTTVFKEDVQVTGILVNDSSLSLSSILITAILFDKNNQILNVSTALVDEVKAFSEKSFKIYLPSLPDLVKALDSNKTQVFYEITEN